MGKTFRFLKYSRKESLKTDLFRSYYQSSAFGTAVLHLTRLILKKSFTGFSRNLDYTLSLILFKIYIYFEDDENYETRLMGPDW